MQWEHQEFNGLFKSAGEYKMSNNMIVCPCNFELMKESTRKLSEDIPFVRVDFYECMEQMYFGELTFFPAGGLGDFEPKEWSVRMGEMIKLPRMHYL
jgi:hypothetical protein